MNGVLIVDKPEGLTSAEVVRRDFPICGRKFLSIQSCRFGRATAANAIHFPSGDHLGYRGMFL